MLYFSHFNDCSMANFLTRAIQTAFQKKLGSSLNYFRTSSLGTASVTSSTTSFKYIPQLAKIENNWIYRRNEDISVPLIYKHEIQLPKSFIFPMIEDPMHNEIVIDAPSEKNDVTIEAARLVVIRRQKMKNHKLKKLRKKLKFERAKIRQKRELKKEKEFQEKLIQQCKKAEVFSAEEYVQNRIQKYQEALSYVPKKRKTYFE